MVYPKISTLDSLKAYIENVQDKNIHDLLVFIFGSYITNKNKNVLPTFDQIYQFLTTSIEHNQNVHDHIENIKTELGKIDMSINNLLNEVKNINNNDKNKNIMILIQDDCKKVTLISDDIRDKLNMLSF